MQLRHEISYDAPADAVWEMLADPAFREGTRVRVDQVQPTAGVPSFARKFAGEVKVMVPLIGGRLESFVADIEAGMDNEHTAGVARLGGDR